MSRKSEICPSCGNGSIWGNDKQCSSCDEYDRREERLGQYDVSQLNDVETLDELKDWIKEHLIK